jgi:transcriptional regulator with XRE-family HTH domain
VSRLKFLRQARGLRQHQIADFLKIPRPHVSQIENGVRNPTSAQLNALARFFNCPANTLLQPMSEAR